ncbi:MAG: hypothetical protein AAGF98_18000 [Cyanobacteria bacterium P01_H01_bin.153]
MMTAPSSVLIKLIQASSIVCEQGGWPFLLAVDGEKSRAIAITSIPYRSNERMNCAQRSLYGHPKILDQHS